MAKAKPIEDLSAPPQSPAYLVERDRLPPELRAAFEALVQEYRHYAIVHYRTPFVSYKILGDLIRSGWRYKPN